MSNYPTTQQFGLSIQLKSLAEQRFKSPSVSSIDDKALQGFLLKIISETYMKCGIKTDANELKVNTTLFKEELRMFPYITIKELQKSFNDGYKEKYGKYYGLSVKTFVGWLDYYVENVRNEDLSNARIDKPKIKEELSDYDKKKLIHSGMKKCIEYYDKNFKILDGYIFFLYDIFYDDGFLPKDKETKEKFYNDAKTFLEMHYDTLKTKSKAEYTQLKEDKENIKQPKSSNVIKQAKQMMVEKFLRETYRSDELIKELKTKYKIG